MDWTGKYWRGVFSESDGTPSSSRVTFAISLGFALGWITSIIWVHLVRGVEPPISKDILDGFAIFIGASGTGYGINKISSVFQKPE